MRANTAAKGTNGDGPADVRSLSGHETEAATIFANTSFVLNLCTSDLRYVLVSGASARMLGRRPEEIEGKLIADVIGEEAFQQILPHMQRVLQGEPVE